VVARSNRARPTIQTKQATFGWPFSFLLRGVAGANEFSTKFYLLIMSGSLGWCSFWLRH